MRDEVLVLRRDKVTLESALLERDARALDLRFEVESSSRDLERMRRRISELESSLRALSDRGGGAALLQQAKGQGSKKEVDLERLVDSLKRVVEKLKSENEKLKRTNASDERVTLAEKKVAAEKRRAEALEAELKTIQNKMKSLEDSGQKLVQRQQQIALLRRQMKLKEEEVFSITAAKQELDSMNMELKENVAVLEEKIAGMEAKFAALGNQATASVAEDLSRRISEQELTITALRSELQKARSLIERTGSEQSLLPRNVGTDDFVGQLQEENRRLREELSAFDLDFFEEIENLKYAHAEAVRKLRILEQQAGGIKRPFV